MPSVIYSSRRTNIMYSIIMQIIYNRRNGKSSWIRRKNWRKCSSYRLWRQNGQLSIKQLSSMISVALRDSESGSNVSYLKILPNLQKTYTLNILVNISKYTCVKVESHIRTLESTGTPPVLIGTPPPYQLVLTVLTVVPRVLSASTPPLIIGTTHSLKINILVLY